MSWIKLYDDLLTDPKILSLSERNQLLWVRLLLLMKSQGTDGILTSKLSGLASALHVAPKQMDAALTDFQKQKMIEVESEDSLLTVCIVHWQERQGTYSPSERNFASQQVQPTVSSSAERVRRYRQSKRNGHVTPDVTQSVTPDVTEKALHVTEDVTLQSVTCNVTVTEDVTLSPFPPHTPSIPLSKEREAEQSRAEQSRKSVTLPTISVTSPPTETSALPCLPADFSSVFDCFSDAERYQIPSAITHIQAQNFTEEEAFQAVHELHRRRKEGKQKPINALHKLGVIIAHEQRNDKEILKNSEKNSQNFSKNSEKSTKDFLAEEAERQRKEEEHWKQCTQKT